MCLGTDVFQRAWHSVAYVLQGSCKPSVVSLEQEPYRALSWAKITSGDWFQIAAAEAFGVHPTPPATMHNTILACAG